MRDKELPALASQSIHASLQVDVQPRGIVDGEGTLRWQVRVQRVDLALQTAAVDLQKGREVDEWLWHLSLDE